MDIFNEEDIAKELSNPKRRNDIFTAMVNQYTSKLYWVIRRIVIYHDDADDVLQNTFLKAWMNLDDFQGKSKIYTWLYRIAINESLDFLRRKKKIGDTCQADDPVISSQLLADKYFEGDAAEAYLKEAIALLPDVQRMVFNMRYYDNIKYSEMSNILHTSEGALKASYHIAVNKVSKYLKNKEIE